MGPMKYKTNSFYKIILEFQLFWYLYVDRAPTCSFIDLRQLEAKGNCTKRMFFYVDLQMGLERQQSKKSWQVNINMRPSKSIPCFFL